MNHHFKKHFAIFLVLASFTIAAKAQVIPYARIEIDNFYELTYGPWSDEWKEAQGDLFIRFYEDYACTIPYTLTADLTVQVRNDYEQTYNGTPTGWGSSVYPYYATSGYNYHSIGATYLYTHHYLHYPYPYQENNDNVYSVEDPGDGSYYPMPTVTN